jgi:hypothetical protein
MPERTAEALKEKVADNVNRHTGGRSIAFYFEESATTVATHAGVGILSGDLGMTLP